MEAHAAFFDHLVELVPAKHYFADDAEAPVNLKYLKKDAKAAAKAAFKQQYKANKRAKLDPDQARTTLELQQQRAGGGSGAADGTAESDSGSEGEEEGGSPVAARQKQPGAVGAGQLALPTGAPGCLAQGGGAGGHAWAAHSIPATPPVSTAAGRHVGSCTHQS